MKTNISQQGLNLADLLDQTATTSFVTPTFNATSETSAYYEVTEPISFIINATEDYPVDMERYASSSTTFSPTRSTGTSESTTTATATALPSDHQSTTGTCFQIMVDCSFIQTTTESTTTTTTTTTSASASASTTTGSTSTTTLVASEEIIYDEEDEIAPRSKRQIATADKTTPKSIGRLLDSLNSILRGLKRNTTSTAVTATTSTTTTTESSATERMSTSFLASTPESLDDLMRWHTAGLQLTTTEQEDNEEDNDSRDDSSSFVSNNIFDVFEVNGNDPSSMDLTTVSIDHIAEQSTTVSDLPVTVVVVMCPLVVCPWNDTVGYLSTLTTNLPSYEDDWNSSSLCRGDNPQGCTPFWTSSRDETITSLHSTSHFGGTLPTGTFDQVFLLFH